MMPTRRTFLARAGAGVAALGLVRSASAQAAAKKGAPVTARQYLSEILYSRQEVDDWLAERAFPFAKYHSEFGWLLRDARFPDGVDGSWSTYVYSKGKYHERLMTAYADRPCRINTYGNSFTQCHQVSDHETWQEVLAGHLCEPVRNFGIGGWSVYQAYRRMKFEESRCPADLIILNIYDDDHYRNLDAWRNIRARKHRNFIEPTLPYLTVDVGTGAATEHDNPCPTPESVYHLCDLDWVEKRFRDDFVLNIRLAHRNAKTGNPDLAYESVMQLAKTHGINTRTDLEDTASEAAATLHRKAALLATMRIVEWVEAFAKKQRKKVLYVLSYGARNIARRIQESRRFDQNFVDFLEARKLPVVDLMAAHVADYAKFKINVKEYLKRYYIGHYNPLGNVFTAFAIKDKVIEMLDPKPPAYRSS